MKALTSYKDELTADPLYPFLKAYLIETTGLNYYADKDDELTSRIHVRLSSLGLADCASYMSILRDPLRGGRELDELICEITIGETYFFRHQEHFDALRDVILPDLLARNAKKRSLIAWSAGCADGPEVYSLAILLERELSHRLADWDVSIIGTDINRRSLARARQGKFDEWSLRTTAEDLKRDCFLKDGTSWQIAAKYKKWVSFQYHNLALDPVPPLNHTIGGFDLIICRNVTIYFGADLAWKMADRFHEWLVDGAWLLVGPTEPNMTFFNSFCPVNAPGVTLYRKAAHTVSPSLPADPPKSLPSLSVPPPKACSLMRAANVSSPQVDHSLADVRSYADRGEWDNAVQCCEQLLRESALNPVVHFYHALVLQQTGHHSEAEFALRRAIYLDRQSALPHYYLGLFLQSRGDQRQAVRSFENAIELLEARSDAEVFDDADGMTVAEMKNLAKMHLEVLQSQ